ncbi:MAG: hypothetical protein AAFX93_16160 [Verrucomicrobiota bacterium]
MKAITPILIVVFSAITGVVGFFLGQKVATDKFNSQADSPPDTVLAAEASVVAEAQASPEPTAIEEPVAIEPTPIAVAPSADPGSKFTERAMQKTFTLTNKQGVSIRAAILSISNDTVKLRREDGLETSIKIDILKDEDQEFCHYLRDNMLVPQPPITADGRPPKADGIDWGKIFQN